MHSSCTKLKNTIVLPAVIEGNVSGLVLKSKISHRSQSQAKEDNSLAHSTDVISYESVNEITD
jgi:hypothetical protein